MGHWNFSFLAVTAVSMMGTSSILKFSSSAPPRHLPGMVSRGIQFPGAVVPGSQPTEATRVLLSIHFGWAWVLQEVKGLIQYYLPELPIPW